MNIAQATERSIESIPAGQIFGYQELPLYAQSPTAVVKAVNRLVSDARLARLSKGRFYVPKKGILGAARKPSDGELIRAMLYKDGRRRGYITGLSLYNQLGLTTQIPRTVTIALNGSRQQKEFGTIRIKTVATRAPVDDNNVRLLQYLDALKDIKTIPDTTIDLSLKILRRKISELSDSEKTQFLFLAENYYGPQVRAISGLLFSNLRLTVPESLKRSLNPTTFYKLALSSSEWPQAKDWNIR